MNEILEEVCGWLHNWFLVPGGVHIETYTVEDNTLTLPFLQDGQYYRIIGSVFNDGLHKYGEADLADETFHGAVWELVIPPTLISIAEEIGAWNTANAAALTSPYQSESFGGYSYSMGGRSDGNTTRTTWRDVFGARLARWRKI